MSPQPPRRDPRRLFTSAERAQIAARQHHACAVCQHDLPDRFHVHHIIPWANGGPTQPDNGIAVCPECHVSAPIAELAGFEPRPWQQEAGPILHAKLRAREFATLNAAPGAGKTLATGWIYKTLLAAGDTARLVVFVPNTHLRTQWAEEVTRLGIYLDTGGTTERRDRDGVVLTYHVLSDPVMVQQIIQDADDLPTLFALDEVHHLAMNRGGEAGAWAVNIARIVGTVDRPSHAVLNLSGTLFRSKRTEQISTIKYVVVGDQIETVADYSITAGRLIAERQLRHIKVLGFDADMTVHAIDPAGSANPGATTIRAVDLRDTRLRSGVLSELIRNPRFIKGIVQETIGRLGHASVALHGAAVKGLIIADSIEHAEQVHAELVDQVGTRNAFIAHGQMASADNEIRRFRLSSGQAIMVAVQKVTEGFDVPHICVLTYLRTWRAPLFINQMVGRAMRITQRERDLDTYLPATILVPNEAEVKAAFADVLVGAMQVLDAPPEPCRSCGREICVCPPRPINKQCNRCAMPWRYCVCPCHQCGRPKVGGCTCPRDPRGPHTPAAMVDVTSDPELAHVNVDGEDVALHIIAAVKDGLRATGMPDVYLEQAASAVQKSMEQDPMAFITHFKRATHEP